MRIKQALNDFVHDEHWIFFPTLPSLRYGFGRYFMSGTATRVRELTVIPDHLVLKFPYVTNGC